jgi:hypothetical protein
MNNIQQFHYNDLVTYLQNFTPRYQKTSAAQRYKAYDLDRYENTQLLKDLKAIGFFEYHTTNFGHIVYYHQIVAYIFCGGFYAMLEGDVCEEGHIEVHHINSNTADNRPSNLVYILTVIHREVTKVQRRANKFLSVPPESALEGMMLNLRGLKIRNRKGKLVRNLVEWIQNILTRTIIETSQFTGAKVHSKSELAKWARRSLRHLRTGLVAAYEQLFLTPWWVVPNETFIPPFQDDITEEMQPVRPERFDLNLNSVST